MASWSPLFAQRAGSEAPRLGKWRVSARQWAGRVRRWRTVGDHQTTLHGDGQSWLEGIIESAGACGGATLLGNKASEPGGSIRMM